MALGVEAFGKYVLLEKLATGGMAEVFLARGTGAGGIGKFFAIKRILPQYADSPEFIDMFKDEAKIAINLSHSNIVSIHEFGVERGQFFLVMDYVEGRNLRQILNKMKKSNLTFSMDQIVFVIKEVAAGLDHAHRCIDGSTGRPLNITHRDMSPQNVMISFEGETKIVDFGIAKAESQIENTRAGTLKGKFGYMSPEQAEGQPVDLRTDIFSLGIVLWELLANDRLFVANNEINTLRKIRDCQVPSLRKINPNMHTELERIVQKALARDRNLRYQTGAALHRDLNRFLNRQYPDFSAQDFAVYIKSVFADEILALRKRLVDYSKMNLSPEDLANRSNRSDADTRPPAQTASEIIVSRTDVRDEDSTSLLDTNTNSFVGGNADSGAHPTEDPNNINLNSGDEDANLEISGLHKDGGVRSGTALLDDAALNAEAMHDRKTLETERLPQRVPRGARLHHAKSKGEYTATRAGQSAPPPARMATFVVFLLLSLGVFSYLVKYYPGTMREVITATAPYAGGYYCALGVLPCGNQRKPVTAAAAAATETRDPASVANAAPAVAALIKNNEQESNGLVVSSNPSGADIFLNDQPTGAVTPSRIEVPAQGTFTIAVRKRGYRDFRMSEVTRESLGHRFDADLTKLSVAYVDVEFFPPQEATLFINGKQVPTHRNLARDIQIPSNVPVKIRAESRASNTYEEVTITLATDQKKPIQLNPRKTSRAPASNP